MTEPLSETRIRAETRWLGPWLLLLALCILPTRTARAIQPDSLLALVGCYELVPGKWQTDSLLSRIYSVRAVPTKFRLDSARIKGWPMLQSDSAPTYVVTAYLEPGHSAGLLTAWSRYSRARDSISVGQPLPMAGVTLVLAPVGQDLVGTMRTFTDQIVPGEAHTATVPIGARRTTCPSDG